MTRHLIIDAQIFQTPAWHRGMGKYSLNLLTALCETNKFKNIWVSIDILLSGQNEINEEQTSELKKLLPGTNIVMLELHPNDFRDSTINSKNRFAVDKYVESQATPNKEIDYLILSIMQGEIFPVFPSKSTVHKLLLFYDLVPLMFHDVYLSGWTTHSEYLTKIGEVLKADIYFTISKTVANDLTLYLGIEKNRIVNIDGGPIEHGLKKKTLQVPTPFILMPTGNDPRKNNRFGILGFNEFNQLHSGAYSLVLTSFFTENEQKDLKKISKDIYFTGNISGEELSYLYEHSIGVLFPSEYEGLGLPILEAVEYNKPVACSNISVFKEMSKTAFYTFEPKSIIGIERALTNLVKSQKVDAKDYHRITQKYQWHKTLGTLVNVVSSLSAENIIAQKKTKIAVFGPSPKEETAAGKLMQSAHAELSRLFLMEYYIPKANTRSPKRVNYLSYISPITELTNGVAFEPQIYRNLIYHISNEKECAEVLFVALANPGVVVLHDINLDEVWAELKSKSLISHGRYELEERINIKHSVQGTSFLGTLLSTQKAVIVFNKINKDLITSLVRSLNAELEVHLVNLPIGNIAYPEALATKSISVGELFRHKLSSNNRPIETPTDFLYNETLSKTKALIFDDKSTFDEIMEATRFTVISFLDECTYAKYRLPQAICYKNVAQARVTAKKLTVNESKTQQITNTIVKHMQENTMEQFIQEVATAIKGACP